jgi:cellulose synthase (UDP-forming)
VLATIISPHGHVFKVTPKGGGTKGADYERGVFWIAAGLMALTIGGLIVNTTPELRIVSQVSLLPMVALWTVINTVVLFLVCMMSLQAPTRRGEERFEFDEPIWIFGVGGALSTGRVKDLSLSGVGIMADHQRANAAHVGDALRVFIMEVGFLTGTVARQFDNMLGVSFKLSPSVERDLLIRKLFTAGLDTTSVSTSAWSATGAMLRSIWTIRTATPANAPISDSVSPTEKLPAESLVVPPQAHTPRLDELVEQRRAIAA